MLINEMFSDQDGEFGRYRDSTVDVLHRLVEVREGKDVRFYDVCNSLSELEDLNYVYASRVDGVGIVYDVTGLGYRYVEDVRTGNGLDSGIDESVVWKDLNLIK